MTSEGMYSIWEQIEIPQTNTSNEEFTYVEDKIEMSNSESIDRVVSDLDLDVFIYRDILAPEIKYNEKLKREHKNTLLKLTKQVIYINFSIIIISVILAFVGIAFFDKIDISFCQELLSFLKYFLTAIFAEFISILFFIVRRVFDSSISDMFGSFKDNKK